jgi:hypothetical protein
MKKSLLSIYWFTFKSDKVAAIFFLNAIGVIFFWFNRIVKHTLIGFKKRCLDQNDVEQFAHYA